MAFVLFYMTEASGTCLVMQVNGSCLVVPHVPPCPQFALNVEPNFFEKAQFSHLIGGDHRGLTCLCCFTRFDRDQTIPPPSLVLHAMLLPLSTTPKFSLIY